MRSTIATVAMTVLILAGASAAFAKGTPQQFTGQITRINTAQKTLAVKQQGKYYREMTFALASDAKITAGAATKSLMDLEKGEHVKVSYTNEGSKHEAERIEVMPAKTAAAK